MDYITSDHRNPNKLIQLRFVPDETLSLQATPEGFRSILLKNGTGIIRLNGNRMMVMAPALLCLNEADQLQVEQSAGFSANALYFHPKVINSAFDFDNIRQSDHFQGTAHMDRGWLRPFISRTEDYRGYLALDPGSFRKISGLIERIAQEMSEQPDNYWPCRSRSYYLELLIFMDHLSRNPDRHMVTSLQDTPDEMDQLLMYLHANYAQKITIPDLTRMFNMNRTTLAERFSAVTGDSVMSYLNQLRIRLAAAMLRDTALPVSEITERAGFGDVTHFGRMFRKITGYTPSEYREAYSFLLKK